MVTLTLANQRRLSECRSQLLAWDGDPPVEEHFLRVLPGLIDAPLVAYQSIDLRTRLSVMLTNCFNSDLEQHTPAFYAHVHEHPLIRATRADGFLPATRISDVSSRAAFVKTGIYNEFFSQIGLTHQLAVGLPARPGNVIGLIYTRETDFADHERAMLESIRPDILQVYRRARRFEMLLGKIRELRGILDAIDAPVIALARNLTIRHTSRRAFDLLQKHFSSATSHGSPRHLPPPLSALVKEAARTGDEGALQNPITTPAGLLQARLSPMPDGWLLTLEEASAAATPESLRQHGLTRRESEVLWWMAQGKTNSGIAALLHARTRTIEKHVERILRKLKAPSRGAAVATANQWL